MAVNAEQLRAYVEYLRDMGIHDLYRHGEPIEAVLQAFQPLQNLSAAPAPAVERRAASQPAYPSRAASPTPLPTPVPAFQEPVRSELFMPKPVSFNELAPLPELRIAASERPAALQAVRNEIGDCTRCPLAYAGRHTIVFANGDPAARLMFVGEGPGADEDASGEPFVGKAGQLLNNMINAMGLQREQVYVANVVKCRPPANRTPEPVEANTCSQFLLKQIDIVQPQVIVALGTTAAMYLLGVKQSLASLRGSWHECRGAKLAVTYHPAFLLRDPRQKGEAWKDLQMVMRELGLESPKRS
jgi:uracil-DNA glycosylase family 4